MKTQKRLGCLILAAVLVLSLVLSGLPTPGKAAELPEATVTVESTYATPGATVEVNLLLQNNPGIAGARLTVSYHEDLELIDGVSVGALSELEYSKPGSFVSPCIFNWDSEGQEVTEDGVMLTLTFRVSETAKLNARLNVDLSCRYGDVYNADLDTVTLHTVGSYLTVLNYLPGDVNDDGLINGKDVTLLRRYNGSGYEVTINETAADVNNDGMINGKDVTLLRRYIAGGYDVKLQPSTYGCPHSLEAVAAKAATCTEDGNLAYWYCPDCNGYFSDAQAVTQITYADTVQVAPGHTEVIDPAVPAEPGKTGLTEGSHCGTCGKVLVAQQITTALPMKYHAITYHNLKGAESPDVTQYSEHEGLASLPKLSLEGYTFKGWYTEEEGGDKITKIPVGATQDYELWARWELIRYTITYNCGQGQVAEGSVATYTVEDQVVLPEAELHYYFFDGWTDHTGAPVTEIAKGSTGNLILTANWKTKRSQAKPIDTMETPLYEERTFVVDGDQYTYIYYLGCIERVPFAWEGVPYEHEGKAIEFEYATSNATSKSIAETMYKVTENTRGWQTEISVSSETEFGCPVGAQETISLEVSHNQSGSTRTTDEEGKTTTISQETVKESNFTFTMEKTDPRGWYRWVKYATVDVFATVTYDVSENKYYIANINAVRDITEGFDYTFKSAAFDDAVDTLLPFDDFHEMEELVASMMEYTEGLVFSQDSNKENAWVVGYEGDATEIVIPAYYINSDGTRVPVTGLQATTSESGSVFAGKNITSVTMGANIAIIPAYAFYNCENLTTVETNGNLQMIGDYAFYGCKSLNYEIPDSVRIIGVSAFAGCEALDRVVISKNVEKLGTGAFMDCGQLDLTVHTVNRSVLESISGTRATSLTVDLSSYTAGNYEWRVTLEVPETVSDFTLVGNEKYNTALDVVSYADRTVIKNMKLLNSHLMIYSEKAEFSSLELTENGSSVPGVQFYGENVELLLSNKFTVSGYADGAHALVCNNLSVQSVKGVNASITLEGSGGVVGGSGIYATGDVTFSGYLNIKVSGGGGFEATDTSARGGDGGAAVCAKSLTLDIAGGFTAIGGSGGRGGSGVNYSGSWANGNGRNGGVGGTGGDGATAIQAEKFVICNAGKLSLELRSGTGGRGGIGGSGENANYSGQGTRTAGKGGNGGQGGNGGHLLTVAEVACDGTLVSNTIQVGSGGMGGYGGHGGDADQRWFIWLQEYSNPGVGGSGGAGGIGGGLGFDLEILQAETSNIRYSYAGTKGDNGGNGVADAL